MSLHLCPKCSDKSFLWTMVNDSVAITQWHCYACGYTAFEDEQNERICALCKNKTESLLKDEDSVYWWCFNCGVSRPSY